MLVKSSSVQTRSQSPTHDSDGDVSALLQQCDSLRHQLADKEHDLELAAELGQRLLQRNQLLESLLLGTGSVHGDTNAQSPPFTGALMDGKQVAPQTADNIPIPSPQPVTSAEARLSADRQHIQHLEAMNAELQARLQACTLDAPRHTQILRATQRISSLETLVEQQASQLADSQEQCAHLRRQLQRMARQHRQSVGSDAGGSPVTEISTMTIAVAAVFHVSTQTEAAESDNDNGDAAFWRAKYRQLKQRYDELSHEVEVALVGAGVLSVDAAGEATLAGTDDHDAAALRLYRTTLVSRTRVAMSPTSPITIKSPPPFEFGRRCGTADTTTALTNVSESRRASVGLACVPTPGLESPSASEDANVDIMEVLANLALSLIMLPFSSLQAMAPNFLAFHRRRARS